MRSVVQNIACILLCMLSVNAASAGVADSAMNAQTARQWEAKAMSSYQQLPDSAIEHFKQAATFYNIAHNYKAAAACLQNAAYVSNDIKKDHYKAAELMKGSVSYWRMTNDKAATADAYRFAVSQHAKINDNVVVRRKADTAISYYTDLKNDKSISQIYLNIATMYDGQQATDSVVKYATLAQDHAKKVSAKDPSIFTISNTMLRNYVNHDKMDEAKAILKKGKKLAENGNVSKEDKMAFYYYGWIYYTKTGDTKTGDEWKAKYDALKNAK